MEFIEQIKNEARDGLMKKYKALLINDKFITRKTVSFQANKENPFYRWFKYKEGFSSNLVKYYIKKYQLEKKEILDPFSGAGTTLFAASELECNATGIELLPVGIFAVEAREASEKIEYKKLNSIKVKLWDEVDKIKSPEAHIKHIRITNGAFPEETENDLNKFLTYIEKLEHNYATILRFAAFAILEEISFTRKDGQYLRWDHRANRSNGKKKFNKGKIYSFRDAIDAKLREILNDINPNSGLTLFANNPNEEKGKIENFQDSCLIKLAELKGSSFDGIITSPPYCNRYDYTRTYALELIFLGCDNEKVKELRQQMLSCTVENKSKIEEIRKFYESINRIESFEKITKVFQDSKAMTEIIEILDYYKSIKKLNNNGIARMVKNYFLEMAFTIFELARVMKKGARIIMVNDNVQYVGEEIPVDLILSEFAENFGLKVENIVVLQQKKGNSSQQMGNHGRNPIRKCVYIWQK